MSRAQPSFVALIFACCLAQSPAFAADPISVPETKPDDMTMAVFLDRLMLAESGGRDHLRNPRSTAVGPFQLIEPTFLEVVRKHFAAETANLTPAQLLALRTDRAFSRRVAEAYTIQNAVTLSRAALAPTFPHLRLAYLVGPSAAIRVLNVPPHTPSAMILGPAAIKANPFLARMTAADLIAKAARDIAETPASTAGHSPSPADAAAQGSAGPSVPVSCDLRRPACQRWLALARQRLASGQPATLRRPLRPGR